MLNSAKNFEVVLATDPAFDQFHEDSDVDRFFLTRDEKYLRRVPGKEPMRFTCRPITHQQAVHYLSPLVQTDAQKLMAFMLSVVSVRNATLRDGTTRDWQSVRVAEAGVESLRKFDILITSEEANENFPWFVWSEVGGVALTRAFFESPWTELQYQPEPSSLAVLAMMSRSRRAEEAKRLADAATSSAKDAPEPGQMPSATDAEPGAATATG